MTFLMIAAAPTEFRLLAKMNLRLARCSSPVIVDGRLYLRLRTAVACYDVRDPGGPKASAAGGRK